MLALATRGSAASDLHPRLPQARLASVSLDRFIHAAARGNYMILYERIGYQSLNYQSSRLLGFRNIQDHHLGPHYNRTPPRQRLTLFSYCRGTSAYRPRSFLRPNRTTSRTYLESSARARVDRAQNNCLSIWQSRAIACAVRQLRKHPPARDCWSYREIEKRAATRAPRCDKPPRCNTLLAIELHNLQAQGARA